MKRILFFLMMMVAGAVLAEGAATSRVAQLEAALNRVHQEQQAVYQQFQMVQSLQRSDMEALYSQSAASGANMQGQPTINYDENAALQRERQERIEQRIRDMNSLYARYVELTRQREALLDQIGRLTAPPPRSR